MFCEKCGKELAPGSVFCPNCGAKQPEEPTSKEKLSEQQTVEPSVEPETPTAPVSPPPEPEPIPADNEAAYRQIIGKNADYYLPQFRQITEDGKGKMNWASFFLTLYHAAYRGVWREWLRAVMWPLIVSFASGLIACATIGSHPDAALLFVLVAACGGIWWIVANILFAKRFNRVYKAYVEQKAARQELSPDPSGKRVVLAVLAYCAVYTLVTIITGAVGVSGLLSAADDFPDSDPDTYISDDVPEPDTGTDEAVAPDTSGMITGTDAFDYLGYWRVDRYNSYLDGYVGFTLESNNDILCFSAKEVWNQGDRVTTIDTTSLDMNYEGTQAGGYYQDDRGNDGNIILEFENGELYLTITRRITGDWGVEMEHEHCTRDPNGAQRQDAEDAAQPSSSGYAFYVDGQTVSQGINNISVVSIGSDRLWPTDTLTISDSDLSKLTRIEVAAIRNEIYARHGYSFSSADWRSYFSTATWYAASSSYSDSMLTSTEQLNRDTIVKFEKAKG